MVYKIQDQKIRSRVLFRRAIDRAIQVLTCFSFERQQLTLGKLAQLTTLSKPTLFRVLQTLETNRFVAYNPESNRYSLGLKIFELGRVVFSTLSLNTVAGRFIDELVAETRCPVALAVLPDDELVYVENRRGTEHVQLFGTEVGQRRPPYFGSLGQAVMAHLPDQEVDRLLTKHPLKKMASRSITDPVLFKERLREVRERGYSYDESEVLEGLHGVAAPIWNHKGKVIGSIVAGFHATLATDVKKKKIIELVVQTARKISEGLGFTKITDGGN